MTELESEESNFESDESDDREKPIVIDNGSSWMKAGFGGDDAPRSVFPSICGRPRHKGVMVGMREHGYVYVGDEAQSKRGILSLQCPIEHGIVTNWNDMENIWRFIFNEDLRLHSTKEHAMLLTESPLNPKSNREKTTQIMFETFDVPSFYLLNKAQSILYAAGKLNGTVVHSGYSTTNIVPIYEGHCIQNAINTLYIGGNNITDYLRKLLSERGLFITTTSAEIEIVNDIKHKLGYIAIDYNKELEISSSDIEQEYELPDGLKLVIGSQRFRCSEILFQPNLIELECDGLTKSVYDAVMKCDNGVHNALFENIVIGGGNTMWKGIEERLLKELYGMINKDIMIQGYIRKYYENNKTKPLYKDMIDLMNKYSSFRTIYAPKERRYTEWIGASILSTVETFKDIWITKDEYDETGPSIIHRIE